MTMPGRPGTEPRQVERTGRKRAERQPATPAPGQVARFCKALGHPFRVRLVACLSRAPHGAAYVPELAFYLKRAQSTVSHHLSALAQPGLIMAEQHGTWTWYQVVPERLSDLREQLSALIAPAVAPTAGG